MCATLNIEQRRTDKAELAMGCSKPRYGQPDNKLQKEWNLFLSREIGELGINMMLEKGGTALSPGRESNIVWLSYAPI